MAKHSALRAWLGDDYAGEPRIYRIVRFSFNGPSKTIKKNLTLSEAQAWCRRDDTHGGEGVSRWFDGYDYMTGCRPKGNA